MTDGTVLRKEFEGATKPNATIEKWKKEYRENDIYAMTHGNCIMFKDLDLSALQAERRYYEHVECDTKNGRVSIGDLEVQLKHLWLELPHMDPSDKHARKQFDKDVRKLTRQIHKHPMYPFWHATHLAIKAVKKLNDMPADVAAAVIGK